MSQDDVHSALEQGSVVFDAAPDVKKATLYPPSGGEPVVVAVGSAQASQLQSKGYTLAPKPDATDSSTPAEGTSSSETKYPVAPTGIKSVPDSSNYFLVEFTDDPTPHDDSTSAGIWLYVKNEGTYRPIPDDATMISLFGEDKFNSIMSNRVKMSISEALASPEWKGTILGTDYAPRGNGYLPTFTANTATVKYGFNRDAELEKKTLDRTLDIMSVFVDKQIISKESFDRIFTPGNSEAAMYVEALTYGGYTLGDVWRDIRLQELALVDPKYAGLRAVSPGMQAVDYKRTSNFDDIVDPAIDLMIPSEVIATALKTNVGNASTLVNAPLYTIADEFFSDVGTTPDWTDPAVREEARKIEAFYYDLMDQTLRAQTEEQKQKADYDWKRFREKVMKQLNITLSDNAIEAWDQLQQAFSAFRERGLADTGVQREATDRFLNKVRREDQRNRENADENISDQEIEQLRTYGTPEEIAAYVNRVGVEKAREVGLIAPDAMRNAYSIENLRKVSASHDKNGNLIYTDGNGAFYYGAMEDGKLVYRDKDGRLADTATLKTVTNMTDDELKNLQGQYIDDRGYLTSTAERTLAKNLQSNAVSRLKYQQDKQASDADSAHKELLDKAGVNLSSWLKTDASGMPSADKAYPFSSGFTLMRKVNPGEKIKVPNVDILGRYAGGKTSMLEEKDANGDIYLKEGAEVLWQ
ncbi:MAG: hypothetical protein WC455_10095 [Dehalococcoidia bacterium]